MKPTFWENVFFALLIPPTWLAVKLAHFYLRVR